MRKKTGEARIWKWNGYTMRLAKMEDASGYYEQNFCPLDQELVRLTGSREVYTETEVKSFFRVQVEDPGYFLFLIFDPDGSIIGESVINELDEKTKNANFRIGIFNQKARGQGIGTWAVVQTRDFAFQELKLHRLSLEVFSFNPRAKRVYEKAGFQKEGVLRDGVIDGEDYGDVILMSILEEEWKQMKTEEKEA